MNVQTFRERRASTVAGMRGLTDVAGNEGRDLTDEEASKFDELRASLGKIDEDIERAEALAAAERSVSVPEIRAQLSRRNPLADLVSADRLVPFMSGQTPVLRIDARASLRSIRDYTRRALVGDEPDTSAGSFPVDAQRVPGIYADARVQTTLVDVLRHVPVSSNAAEFVRLVDADNTAAIQAGEGAAKAEATLGYELATTKIRTYAVTLPISEQLISDAPEAAAHVQSILTYHVLRKFTAEAINGASTLVAGIAESASVFTPALSSLAPDKIGEAAATLRAAGWNADVVLLNPLDWYEIQITKEIDGTSDGAYLAGGWQSPANGPMFGLRVVTDPAVTTGAAFVFDSQQLVIFDRQAITAQYGFVDQQFTENLRTLRVEGRFGFAVVASAALYSVSLA